MPTCDELTGSRITAVLVWPTNVHSRGGSVTPHSVVTAGLWHYYLSDPDGDDIIRNTYTSVFNTVKQPARERRHNVTKSHCISV